MSDINFKNPQGPTNPNQASLLGRNLQDAIEVVSKEGQDRIDSLSDFKDNPVDAAKTVGDAVSTGIAVADVVGKVNPAIMGFKAAYDILTFPGKYSDQSKKILLSTVMKKPQVAHFYEVYPSLEVYFPLLVPAPLVLI